MSVHTIKYASDKQLSKHFSLSEFKCSASGEMKYSDELIDMLEKIFTKCSAVAKGVVTSGYRTPDYSVQVGGSRTDAHTYGIACDIIFYDKANRVISPKYIACICQDLGFGGIGLIKGNRAIHLDVRHLGGYSSTKWWGDEGKDEGKDYSLSAHGTDFYTYCNLSKSDVYEALGVITENLGRNTMFKIALNAGHGLNTSGKRCLKSVDPSETREWTLNSRICNKIEEKLKSYTGYELIRLDDTSGKTDVPLKTRTDKANKFGADFYLAIHHNAGVNGSSGGGVVAIVYTTVKDGSVATQWQQDLYNAIIKKTGLKGNRSIPLQKQDLHEVRESNMPAVLLECGFMDSTTDTPIILTDKFADQVATACVEVLVRKGKLVKKQNEQKQEEKVMQEVRFKYFKDLPDWAKNPIGEMIEKGYFGGKSGTGDTRVIDLGEDAIRTMIVCYNMLKGGEK